MFNMFFGLFDVALFIAYIAFFVLFVYAFILWVKVLRRAVRALDIYIGKNDNDNHYNSNLN